MISLIKKIVKKILGIENLSLYIQKKKKGVLKKIYRQKYSSDDIVAQMKKMGMRSGSAVFIHSSMTEFYNFEGKPVELIEKIIEAIGNEGTLLMPAYPKNKLITANDGVTIDFDVNETPSAAGYLTEVFRKYPGVKRSINIQHSVCAYGKLADYFVSEHHIGDTAWDEKSPYYKLYKTEALVFALGLPYFLGTTIHCTESILKNKYKYFSIFFTREINYRYKDALGNVGMHKMYGPDLKRKRSKKMMIKTYFAKQEFHHTKLSNLRIEMVNARYMLEEYLRQAEKGNVMYSIPSPDPYKRNGKFIEL